MSDLKGKVAIVTGAAARRSMGRAIAVQLASEGADVVINDKSFIPVSVRKEDEDWRGLYSVAEEIEAKGAKALAIEGDVSSSGDVDNLVSKTLEKFGKIDILVHCVGVRGPAGSFLDLEEDTWRVMIDVNLTGAFLVGKAVANAMLPDSEGKKIVLISSTAGIQAAPEITSYCAAKHGLQGLMKSMAVGLAKYKINVNAILPMSFDTNFRDAQMKVDATQKNTDTDADIAERTVSLTHTIPIGRLGTPEDAAWAVSYLVSDKSNYVSGASLILGGGSCI